MPVMKSRRSCKGMIQLGLILALLLLVACAAPSRSWVSRPDVQQVEETDYTLFFEPLREEAIYYSAFRLTVVNRSAEPLSIDWNRTRYLHEGKNAGPFAFKGISAEKIKEGTVAADVVAPGTRWTRIIAPLRLIAFAPLKGKSVGIATEGIRAGKLPEGENGISLLLTSPAGNVRRQMTVRIEAISAAPPP
jgi:hypothetical protein